MEKKNHLFRKIGDCGGLSLVSSLVSVLAICFAGCLLFAGQKQVLAAENDYDYIVTDAQYGVNATDKKSDTDALQNIFTLAKGAKQQVKIYFPAGDYYIDKPMRVYSNTHLILDKNATIHRMDSMIDRMMLHNVDQNGNMDAIGGYKMSENITVEGGTWDGGNIAKAKDAADIIRFDHATNIVVKDCTIKNVYDCHMIEYVGVKNGSISGCTLTGFRYQKGKEKNYLYAREAIQLEAAWTNNPGNKSDVSSLWANGSVVDGSYCQGITVTNNTLINMPCGIGQHHYTTTGKYRNLNITISNNTFTCSSSMKYCKTAITCGGMNTVKIENNKITGPYNFGIHIEQASGITVSGNVLTNIVQNAIMMDTGSVKKLENNTITSAGKHGISVGGGSVSSLTGNTITKVKQNGISIGKGTIKLISDNTIKNVKKHGISITGGCSITSLTGNTITKANQDGITLDKGKIKLLSNNTITNIKKHGLSITGGTIGVGKKRSKGIINNTISTCKQNGISISRKATVSAISKNKITGVKNNGISIIGNTKVYWVTKNTIKKCTKHGIWNGSTKKKAKLKGNKGKTK